MTIRLSHELLEIDLERTAQRLGAGLSATLTRFKRRGVVVAVSGGIDSACVAALSLRAVGKDRVFAIMLPERDSSPESTTLGQQLCTALGIRSAVYDIAPVLEAAGCYRWRNDAVRSVFPEFEPGMRWKMVLENERLAEGRLSVFHVIVEPRPGDMRTFRLTPDAYLAIVAATNFKQRTRKMLEYFHADRLVYAVAGTPNRLEYDQGFFVKLGDGAADVKPIARLYKTQVYALARHLGVPEEICRRKPTTDTFSLPQGQDEFYFSLDYHRLDLLLWAKEHGLTPEQAASGVDLSPEHVRHVYQDIERKRRSAEYLHAAPVVLEPDGEAPRS